MQALQISTALLYGAAIPPAVALSIWTYYYKLEPAYLVEGVAFRLYTLVFLLLLIFELVRNLLHRSLPGGALCLGVVLMLLQGFSWYGFRFSGMTAVGADEQIIDYYSAQTGAFTTPPRIPLKVVSVTSVPKSVTLARDGIESHLDVGKSIRRDGFVLRLAEVEQAPLIAVQSARGEPVDEAYLKLTSTGEREDFIMFGRLPHRFYVKEVRNPESGPPMFKIKVVRDKLIIVDSLVQAGEAVYFDGHYVRCSPGAPWARIAVEKRQTLLLFWSGLLLAVAGLLGGVAKRRGARV